MVFISQPQDTTVSEGSDVRFECLFEGSVRIPDWKIKGIVYYWQYIPHPFRFHLSDFSLSVENVTASLNGTMVQCIVPGEAESSVGLLIVTRHNLMLHTSSIMSYYLVLSHVRGLETRNLVSPSKTSNHSTGKLLRCKSCISIPYISTIQQFLGLIPLLTSHLHHKKVIKCS